MMTILLYGFLGEKYGRVHKRDVSSPAEAVQALCHTLPGFKHAVLNGGEFRVLVGGRTALAERELADPVSKKNTLRIVPVPSGAGRGFGQVLLGAALIFAAPYATSLFSGLGFTGVGAPTAFGVMMGNAVASIGWSLAIGGVAQMLFSPKPANLQTSVDRPENRPSYAFDGAVNTAAQGNPVPVLYGRMIVGSQVISAGLTVEQIA